MQSIAYKASSWWILEEKGSIPSIIQVHQQDKSIACSLLFLAMLSYG
jgi:hypothetical protein